MFGECGRNFSATAKMYNGRHVDGPRVTRLQVAHILSTLQETGSLRRRTPVPYTRPVTTPEIENRVLVAVQESPHTSSRAIGRELAISHQSVLRILHRHKYHPYHVHLHQALRETDYQRRLDFCNWLENQLHDNPHFLEAVLWTDEATFSRDGNVNIHNAHYWATRNPHWLRETDHQERFAVNVFCGILADVIIGPVFLPPHLNGQRFLRVLQDEIENHLDDLPLARRQVVWLQMDGAPPHYHEDVRRYVCDAFPDRWIGRGSPVPWPPRSPDLTPLDFFLWGYVKERVYTSPPLNVADLQRRIIDACQNIPACMIQNVRRSIRARARLCIVADGKHFEQYL